METLFVTGHEEGDKYDLIHHAWVIAALAHYGLYEKAGSDTHMAPQQADVPVDVDASLISAAKYLGHQALSRVPPPSTHTSHPPHTERGRVEVSGMS